MLRTKGMFTIPILLFSFMAIPSFAKSQGCCGQMMGSKGMGMMKASPMAMMKGGLEWRSQQSQKWDCPMWDNSEREIVDLTKEEAGKSVEDYLYHYGNPNLKVGKIKEKDDYFEVEVVTKNNSLVEKIRLDKKTG